jgi:hypothetical protein
VHVPLEFSNSAATNPLLDGLSIKSHAACLHDDGLLPFTPGVTTQVPGLAQPTVTAAGANLKGSMDIMTRMAMVEINFVT